MKVIVAGSRTITDYDIVSKTIINSGFSISEIVSGGAKGVDQLGERFAREVGIPIKRFLPDWRKFGRSAGIIRNKEMVQYADALVAIWDGKSKGTKDILTYAQEKGLLVFGEIVKQTSNEDAIRWNDEVNPLEDIKRTLKTFEKTGYGD